MFYSKYAPIIYGLIKRVVSNDALSEKLFSEVLIQTWKEITLGVRSRSIFLQVLNTARKAIREHSFEYYNCNELVKEDVFNLIFLYGHTSDEVSKIMQLPINEVKLRFSKTVRSFSVSQ